MAANIPNAEIPVKSKNFFSLPLTLLLKIKIAKVNPSRKKTAKGIKKILDPLKKLANHWNKKQSKNKYKIRDQSKKYCNN